MSKKLIYIALIFFMGSTIFLFLQNKALTEKIDEILAVSNYKSLSYLTALDNKEYAMLKTMLVEDLKQFTKMYKKNIYFNHHVLKNICKDIDTIEHLAGEDTYLSNIDTIKRDCKKK